MLLVDHRVIVQPDRSEGAYEVEVRFRRSHFKTNGLVFFDLAVVASDIVFSDILSQILIGAG